MMYCGWGTSKSLRSWITFPVFLSTQTADSFVASGVALLTQTWSPHTTGDDHALPSTGVFHATFSVSLQLTGKPLAPSAIPCPPGPRNCGQLPPAAAVVAASV